MPADLFHIAHNRCLTGIIVSLVLSTTATPFAQCWANEARNRIDQEISAVANQVQGVENCSIRFGKIKKLETVLIDPKDVSQLSYRSLIALFSIVDTNKFPDIGKERCFSYSIMSFLERAELNRRKLAPALAKKLAEYRIFANKIRDQDKNESKSYMINATPQELLAIIVKYNAIVSQIDGEVRSLARAFCAISDKYPIRCVRRVVRSLP